MHTLHAILENPIMLQSSNPKRIAMNVADRTASPSPTTVARKLSNPEVPQTRPSYTKTSISHILPVTWKSPITQPTEDDEPAENTSVKANRVAKKALSSKETKLYKEKLSSLYTTLPPAAQTQLTEARFTKYMVRAITHDDALRTLFQTKGIPRIDNLSNLTFETFRQSPFNYAAFNIQIKGHETGNFVVEKRQDYTLIGWCQNKPFSFQVQQKYGNPNQRQPQRPTTVFTNTQPSEARLTTAHGVIKFSKGTVQKT